MSGDESSIDYELYFRVRTITCFVNLDHDDFRNNNYDKVNTTDGEGGYGKKYSSRLEEKIRFAAEFLQKAESMLTLTGGYTVQTIRIATNPFGEWLDCDNNQQMKQKLQQLDTLLEQYGIEFCSLGPANTFDEINNCIVPIISISHRFSCSSNLRPNDSKTANAIAAIILQISQLNGPSAEHLQGGLGNFRFCCTSENTKSFIPFFPAAKSSSSKEHTTTEDDKMQYFFAVGLENGPLFHRILSDCCNNTLSEDFSSKFMNAMIQAYMPVQVLCQQLENEMVNNSVSPIEHKGNPQIKYMGIDTSLNPSLDDGGSVVAAIEAINVVTDSCFGRCGTLAVVAAITQCLQSLDPIIRCGYCGLMLPLCEDQRLAELVSGTDGSTIAASATGNNSISQQPPPRALRIADLLSISQICGVGVDTVPIPGNCSVNELASLLLDVTGIAHRWNKSLSCRVFPVPGKLAGEWTTFDSPYMVNSKILPLS